MSVKVIQMKHDCKEDGHVIALRLHWDLDDVKITPFCERCHKIFLPSASMSGWQARWLMRLVDEARFAPDAPDEAYESMFR